MRTSGWMGMAAVFAAAFAGAARPTAAQGRDTLRGAVELEQEMARLRREMEALRSQQRELRERNRVMVRRIEGDAGVLQICEYRDSRQGWLGITFDPPRTVRVERGRGPLLTFSRPIGIEQVAAGSPAAKAGLAIGDSITAFNGEAVEGGTIAFEELLQPGSTLAIRARRAGREREFKVDVAPRPAADSVPCREMPLPVPLMASRPQNPLVMMLPATPDMPEPPRPGFAFTMQREVAFVFGAQFGMLTEELAELTGAKQGVFVVSVAEGSPAANGGLKVADVIQRVGDAEVRSPAEIRRHWSPADRRVQLTVLRKKKPQTLTVAW